MAILVNTFEGDSEDGPGTAEGLSTEFKAVAGAAKSTTTAVKDLLAEVMAEVRPMTADQQQEASEYGHEMATLRHRVINGVEPANAPEMAWRSFRIRHGKAEWRAVVDFIVRRWGHGKDLERTSGPTMLVTSWWKSGKVPTEVVRMVGCALAEAFPGAWVDIGGSHVVVNLAEPEPSYAELAEEALSHVPGADKVVRCPAIWTEAKTADGRRLPSHRCDTQAAISYLIQHLNDYHEWEFPQIADWLDELHISGQADLTVHPEGEEPQ